MKKKSVVLAVICLAVALSVSVLAGCSNSNPSNTDNAAENESSAASAKTTLVVGFNQTNPPYSFVNADGSYVGFDVDLATAVAADNGWDIKLEPIDWTVKDQLLESGSISCIWSGLVYEGRETAYTWSDRYLLIEQVIVVEKGSEIADKSDLAGKTVVTQEGSDAFAVLSDPESEKALADTFEELQTVPDYASAFLQLDSGLADAVACDLSTFDYQKSATSDKYEIISVLSEKHCAVAFKKGNDEMAKAVNTSLSKLDKDGTVKQLCEKYADYGMDYNTWCLGK